MTPDEEAQIRRSIADIEHLSTDTWSWTRGSPTRTGTTQNWAVLRQAAAPGELRLASSYDHASSLGFNLLDARRETLLGSGAVADWAARGIAHRFEHDPGSSSREIPTLVAAAHDALDLLTINRRRPSHER